MTARTPAGTPPPAARITILDILRALALLGIVIVHTHDHFNLYLPMPPAEGWQAAANSAADWAYEHLFVSKSFLLFSFLFGLSFFIQLDRREQQGIDFRKRFMWRLTLLFLLGLAHTLFYDGDILTLFGTLGFALVMLYKCGTPLLITLCALCLIQPVILMDLLNHAGLADWWPHSSGWFHTGSPAAGPTREFLYAHGSWGQAALWNLTQGQAGKWQFFLLSGRLWQTIGLFILGMLAGRWRTFEDAPNKRRLFLRTLGVAGILFLALLAMRLYLIPQLGAPLEADAARLLHPWENLSYTVAFVSAAVLLFTHPGLPLPARLLSSAGKCTLTCYVAPDAGLHLPLLRVGAGPGTGHGAVAMPVRGRGRLPPPGMGLLPLAKPIPGTAPWNGSGVPPPCAACSLSANGCPKKIEILFTFFPFHPDFSERRRNRTHSLLRPARNKTIPALQEVRTMLKYPAATEPTPYPCYLGYTSR